MRALTDNKPPRVTASELAKLAVCEQQLLLNRRYGEVLNQRRRQAINAGERVHAAHHRAVLAYQSHSRAGRCFIATAVYGPDAPQTQALRQFRDQVLKAHPAGQWLIKGYEKTSPRLARWLAQHPRARLMLRRVLDPIIRTVQAYLEKQGR